MATVSNAEPPYITNYHHPSTATVSIHFTHSISHTLEMELKNYLTTVFIIFILLALPALSTGRLKPKMAKLDTDIYDIDYREPESHFSRPPKVHGESKRPSTEKARKKIKKAHG